MDARRALIEVLGRDGSVHLAWPVHRWPVSLGRAFDNDLVLDDPHVAPYHARLVCDEDDTPPGVVPAVRLHVGQTVNGVDLDGRHLEAFQSGPLVPGAQLSLGGLRLRVRLPGEALAPERPLARLAPGAWRAAAAGLVAWMAVHLLERWLALEPGARWSDWLSTLLGLPLMVLAWAGAWSLLSKLFQHRLDYLGHLRVAVGWLLVDTAASWAAVTLSGLWGWHAPTAVLPLVQIGIGAALLHGHLALLMPGLRRGLGAAAVALTLTGITVTSVLHWQRHDRVLEPLYPASLPPPAWSLVKAVPAQRLLEDLRGLQPMLQRSAADEARADDGEGGAD
jgi:hypothetical protein